MQGMYLKGGAGFEFQGRMAEFAPKIQKSCRKKLRGREALKNSRFSGNFSFYETKLSVSGKFTNFQVTMENFLKPVVISYCRIGCDSFQILSVIECSLIQEFRTQLQNIKYFAGFQRINSALMQNDHRFKNYQLQMKFIFQQLVSNFTNIRQQNSIFRQKKKKSF